MKAAIVVCLVLFGVFRPGLAIAAEATVAVAANFTAAAKEIASAFTAQTGHEVALSFGSTGQLYTQIAQGAPFDVFLAADQARPLKAVEEGLAVAGTLFTYATGRIVLYSTMPDLATGEAALRDGEFAKIAIANPATAPYGAAAVETMEALGVYGQLAPKIVQGNNIAQAYQFIETGNAEIGFVALSQVINTTDGSRWVVPEDLHGTIAQDAVLLIRGEKNEAARAFIAFLRGPEAREVKETYGYGTGG